jgi:hypothetical protein
VRTNQVLSQKTEPLPTRRIPLLFCGSSQVFGKEAFCGRRELPWDQGSGGSGEVAHMSLSEALEHVGHGVESRLRVCGELRGP